MDDSMQTQMSERQGAALAHASGVFLPFVGPMAVFFIGNKSLYVRYHALHAFLGMLLLNIFLFTVGAISIGYSIYGLWQHYQENFQNFEWWPVILKSAVTWIVLALIGLINTVVNLVQAYRAYQGKWPGKSLTTAIVNKFVKRNPAVPASVSP